MNDVVEVTLGSRIKTYAKAHTFHFMMMIAMALLVTSHVSQIAVIAGLDGKINHNQEELLEAVKLAKNAVLSDVEAGDKTLQERVDAFRVAIQARVDTIDSTIKPDEKRRTLIKSVRDAITENTNTEIGIRTLNKIAIAVVDYSYVYNLPIANVLAQMRTESNFNVKAASHAHAKGLMQIIDPTAADIARELGRKRYNIWDINTNVEFGCYYMAKMLTVHKNNLDDALRAYNFGPHNVAKVKAGEADYSLSKIIDVDGAEIQYLVDKYGKFVTDEDGLNVVVTEEHKYPKETRLYVKSITQRLDIFSQYGLDKVE